MTDAKKVLILRTIDKNGKPYNDLLTYSSRRFRSCDCALIIPCPA